MSEGPVIAASALRHGVTADDIRHALRHPVRIWDLGDGFVMTVGSSRAAALLEVGTVEGNAAVVVVHAMPARAKFLR